MGLKQDVLSFWVVEDCWGNNKHRTPITIVESAMELLRNTKRALQVCTCESEKKEKIISLVYTCAANKAHFQTTSFFFIEIQIITTKLTWPFNQFKQKMKQRQVPVLICGFSA